MSSSEFIAVSTGWMLRGACRGEDPELFFPVTAASPALAQVLAAKAVCFRCVVRAACLSYALATGQAGIWGGTTQEERQAMRRPSRRPAREHSASPRSWSGATAGGGHIDLVNVIRPRIHYSFHGEPCS
jgi:WhiB family transcriptional regulator, redox-sensing transcriptional regulator